MSGTVRSNQRGAKSRTGSKCDVSRPKVRKIHPAIEAFKAAYPERGSAPYELVLKTKISLSYAEKVLSGAQQPGADLLVALLQSETGREVLIALMADARPKWWAGFRKNLEIAAALRSQAELARRIEALQRGMGE